MTEAEKLESVIATLTNKDGHQVRYVIQVNQYFVEVEIDGEATRIYHGIQPGEPRPEYLAPNAFVAKIEALRKAIENFQSK